MKYIFEAYSADDNYESTEFIAIMTVDKKSVDARMQCFREVKQTFPSLNTLSFNEDEHASVVWYYCDELTEADKKKLAALKGDAEYNPSNTYEGTVSDDFVLETEPVDSKAMSTLYIGASSFDWEVTANVRFSPRSIEACHLCNSGGIPWPFDRRFSLDDVTSGWLQPSAPNQAASPSEGMDVKA